MTMKPYVALIAVLLFLTSGFQAAPPTLSFPANAPDEWESKFAASERFKNDCVTELLAIAQDQTKPDAERMSAILLLGKFGGRQTTKYCLEYIRLSFNSLAPSTASIQRMYDQSACYLALNQVVEHDGEALKEVVSWLQVPHHEEELRLISRVIRLPLHNQFALDWIKDELSKRPGAIYEKNLKELDRWISP